MTALAAGGLTGMVLSGSLLLAAPVAALAGLVSFLSPCVLPLVPGYLSYVTGLSGADLAGTRPAGADLAGTRPSGADPAGTDRPVAARTAGGGAVALQTRPRAGAGSGRVLAGSALFVLGFSAVFVTAGAFFGTLGSLLAVHADVITRVLGALTIVLGLGFLGLVPGLQREVRLHRLPVGGLAGAPLLGVMFGLGWTPCIGPTLAAVQTLAYDSASAGRGALLTAAYCAGLGVPFILSGLLFRRALGAFAVVRAHSLSVMRVGGVLLIAIGLLLVSGLWDNLTIALRGVVSGFTPAV